MSCTACPDWTDKFYKNFKIHVKKVGCGGEARLANDPVNVNPPLEEAKFDAGTGINNLM